MNRLRLSALDQSPVSSDGSPASAIRNSLELVTRLDGQGFTRYWFAEHHHSVGFAGAAPEVLVAAALERTRQLRIGSGGVLLPRYSAAKVAEVFTVLAASHGQRLDVGLGRAADGGSEYLSQLLELQALIGGSSASGSSAPDTVRLPMWLLGAGTGSSELAAQLGASFAYGHFLNPTNATEALRHYRRHFQASYQAQPDSIMAVRAVVGATEARSRELAESFVLWRSRKDLGVDAPFPTVVQTREHAWTLAEARRREANFANVIFGSPEHVSAQLLALVDGLGVDEVMVNTPLAGLEDRAESYLLLAAAFTSSPSVQPSAR